MEVINIFKNKKIDTQLKYGLLVREDGEFITPRTGTNSIEVEYINEPYVGICWVAVYVKPVSESPGVAMPVASIEYYNGVYNLIDEAGVRFTLATYQGPNQVA
jgi:hypothetical protein